MSPEYVRSIAERLERYFDWYFRADPDASPEAVTLVTRFTDLARGPKDVVAAKRLFEESGTVFLGSAWEEMRLALKVMATA